MQTHRFASVIMNILFGLVLAILTGCAHPSFEQRHLPENGMITFWGEEHIPIGPEWTLQGPVKIMVRGSIENSNLQPADLIQTLVYSTQEESSPSILLLTRATSAGTLANYRYLGGNKVEHGNTIYRETLYSLDADSTDPEYRRYFDLIRTKGREPAPSYLVRVLDRLPVDTVLIRIMELSPGQGHAPLPSYGRLYPQERNELIRRDIWP